MKIKAKGSGKPESFTAKKSFKKEQSKEKGLLSQPISLGLLTKLL